jgi:hypothetical protein
MVPYLPNITPSEGTSAVFRAAFLAMHLISHYCFNIALQSACDRIAIAMNLPYSRAVQALFKRGRCGIDVSAITLRLLCKR